MSNTIGTVMIDIKADISKLIKSTEKAQKYMQKTVGNMQKSVLGLAAAYVTVETAVKGVELVFEQAKAMVKVTAQFEQFDATLKTLTGSSQAAEQSMKWISDFASKTPFNIDKVTSSFISLKSYGLDPTDGLLRTLGDTSAAMGKDIQQSVEAMADAVVGENERLKEFGIRASKIGNNIKYSWTNSSGEMRQAIVENNSAIIESTLSAIFNSKYAGAMEAQSKTWNGMISNLQDNWTIFEKNIMDSGVFDYLKAIVTVIGDDLTNAFGKTIESSAAFSKYVIDGIKSIISSFGYTYDALETFGDYFTVVGKIAELAFDGIMVGALGLGSGIVNIFEDIIDGVNKGFESLVNGVISAINSVLDIAASLGFGNGGNIGNINLGKVDIGGDFLKSYSDAADKVFIQTSKELGKAWDDLLDANSGQVFTDNMLKKIDVAYDKIKNTPTINSDKTDFGDAPTTKATDKATQSLKDYDTTLNDIDISTGDLKNTTDDVSDNFSNLNDTLYSKTDDNNTYTVTNKINDSFDSLNNTASTTIDAVDDVSKSLDKFIFKFQDTFINSINSTMQSLDSISQKSSLNTLSYEDALTNASSKRDALIKNPLDVNIGKQYTDAYNIFIDSADKYLGDMNNFSSQQDYMFAQATVGSQAETFQSTAEDTVDVLESMNNFLSTINQAFSDGVLTDEEKATISNVATNVNAKNEILLGDSSVVVAGLNGIPTSLDNQEYYNNAGLALNTSLVGTNSVSDFIKDITKNGTVSLDNLKIATEAVTTATGLTTEEVSSLSSDGISINGQVDTDAADAVATMAGGKTLQNLIIKKETVKYSYPYVSGKHYDIVTNQIVDTSGFDYTHQTGSTTSYEYYADGGFTGLGIGKKDSTGFKQAGIVHEEEWVAPKWMIRDNPQLFGALEMARLSKKSSIDLSSNSTSYSSTTNSNNNTDKYLFVVASEMKDMNSLLRRITKGGQAMRTEAVS